MSKWQKKWPAWFPLTLKYRLIVTFVALLLLPLCLAVYSLFRNFESIRQDDLTGRMSERMQQVHTSLTDMMAFAYKTHTMLSQDEGLIKVMDTPENYDPIERKRLIESKMSGINNSFFFHQTELFFKLIDHEGNVYTSYSPNGQLTNSIDEFQRWKSRLERSPQSYEWVASDPSDIYNNRDSKLLSLYILLQDQRRGNYGLARISIDAQEWFDSTVKNIAANQEITVFTGKGESVLRSSGASIGSNIIEQVIKEAQRSGSYRDASTASLVTYSYLDKLDWYVVSRISLDDLWSELTRLRIRFFLILALLVVVFVAVIFLIASRVTRPLSALQKKMEEASEKKLNVRLDIKMSQTREIASLGSSFNRMINDIGALIQRLKEEERQKQAVRFQMLLTQMNPHFLLNTLNMLKWMARKEKQAPIVDICIALGGLLEASLNSELELLPLHEEIGLLKAYESIQKLRYQSRFTMLYEVDESVTYALVPKLSLQPLVENAIVHGFDSEEQIGTIIIRAKAENGKLILEVEDNGIGLEEASKKRKRRSREGIGISNVKERLQLLYKEDAILEFVPIASGTLARMTTALLVSTPFTEGGDNHVDSLPS
ncbi:cache domain-containing sensor histidine kinase [Paenibacillus qinlingensis]|uniref:cache domain-containing sensor histidine kinase n=1 Tax=Paenibacillus qinlingensis TaxID=1837343 RepID=UPI001562FC0D|nr:histidine kinase [Paenibacillus qinlingensis]NQX60538.1 histidine kinase [Paenibacillus qinlingensis]